MGKTGRRDLQGEVHISVSSRSVCDAYGRPSEGIKKTILYVLGIHMDQIYKSESGYRVGSN